MVESGDGDLLVFSALTISVVRIRASTNGAATLIFSNPLGTSKKFQATGARSGGWGVVSKSALARVHLPTDGAQGYCFGRQDITGLQFNFFHPPTPLA